MPLPLPATQSRWHILGIILGAELASQSSHDAPLDYQPWHPKSQLNACTGGLGAD